MPASASKPAAASGGKWSICWPGSTASIPPDGPGAAGHAVPPPLRGGMGGLRADFVLRHAGAIKPTMIARAGGLDQGNIILNLADAERRGLAANVLFLAGSAINSVKNARGRPDPRLGTEAMLAGFGGASLGRVGRHVGRGASSRVDRAGAEEELDGPRRGVAQALPGEDWLKRDVGFRHSTRGDSTTVAPTR